MADVNVDVPHPVRSDEQIGPHNRWIVIGKSNCYIDMTKSQPHPIYKIAVDLLKNTSFFGAHSIHIHSAVLGHREL